MAIYLKYVRPEKRTIYFSVFKRYLSVGDIVRVRKFTLYKYVTDPKYSLRILISKTEYGWLPADLACFDYIPKKDYERYGLL